jgi:UDP-4-amino-4-deoxy-L-arabinose-oxoglutarate aminotransferase
LEVSVPFFRHALGGAELASVAEVLAGRVLTTGETVARFERAFAQYLGRRHAVAVSSCTAALQLSLTALGIGPGDEVITTPMTFVATATAILQAGARPVFVDVEPDTANLDPARIEAALTPRTRAIIPVHLYGQMCDMTAIHRTAARHDLAVIEDAAHCVEGSLEGARPGAQSQTACFSFYATKSLTCGEGGAVVTDDDDLARRLRLLRLHGMTATAADRMRDGYRHWDVVVLGWKYNMDNIHAALLLPQLAALDQRRRRRSGIVDRYVQAFAGIEGLSWPACRPRTVHARHLFPIWVAPGRRDAVLEGLRDAGVEVVVNYRAIHLLSYLAELLQHHRGDFPVAEDIGDRSISLPLYADMPEEHVEQVISAVTAVVADTC